MADPIETHPDFQALQSWWGDRLTDSRAILAASGIDAVWWGYALYGAGAVQDLSELDQSLKIILTTELGSDYHRPEFASDIWSLVDLPIPRATPLLVRETTEAVATWEPRVALDSVAVTPYDGDLATLTIAAQWTIADSAVDGQTEVNLG